MQDVLHKNMYVVIGMPTLVLPQQYTGRGTRENSAIKPVLASKCVSIQKVRKQDVTHLLQRQQEHKTAQGGVRVAYSA